MSRLATSPGLRAASFAAMAVLLLAGCVVQDERPMPRVIAQKATTEVPQDELLDVGVRLFDPNVPQDPKKLEDGEIYPEVRDAESRYIPVEIRDTLEGTGQWGQVRVLPRDATGMDVYVDGKIVESDGRELKLDVTVSDSSGRLWYHKEYEGAADTRAYKDVASKPADPFENVYATLANDLLAARAKLTREQRVQLHEVTDLRFDADLAPYAFGQYLAKDRKGYYAITRLPAADDPVLQRMDRVRERDYALMDTLNEYYTNFAESMAVPYTSWRKATYEELEARSKAQREALTRQILGAVAVVGGIVAGSNSNSSAASAAATAAVIGGMYAFKSGLDQRAEIRTHTESLKQLGDSFQSEVQPMVVDVEGRTLQLKGSAEQQYAEWRQLLKQLYENETGLPATGGTAANGTPTAATKP
ncbi:MAG TPA: hypothetical protein PK163_07960 [Steroidobacteraceae bacterium]|nr:hypothetical protein [Steroidobacteraceae bacterium]